MISKPLLIVIILLVLLFLLLRLYFLISEILHAKYKRQLLMQFHEPLFETEE